MNPVERISVNVFSGFTREEILNEPVEQSFLSQVEGYCERSLPRSINSIYSFANGEKKYPLLPVHELAPSVSAPIGFLFGGLEFLTLQDALAQYNKCKKRFRKLLDVSRHVTPHEAKLFNDSWFPFARGDTTYLFVAPSEHQGIEREEIYLIDHEYEKIAYKIAAGMEELSILICDLYQNSEIDIFFQNMSEFKSVNQNELLCRNIRSLIEYIEKQHNIV